MKITHTNPLSTISRAVDKYLDLITPTYGPAGKKVLIAHNEYAMKAVDDGFEASKEFELENEFENAVVQYIKEATRKTNERAGDGTTTAGILMGAIFKETLGTDENVLKTLKKNYHKEVKEIEQGIKEAIAYIKSKAKDIKTKEELYNIAYNSYNNEEIATLISNTIYKIGENGLLAIGDSQTAQTQLEMVEGLELEKGYASPYFINSEKEECILSEVSILLFKQKVESFKEILPLLGKVKDHNKRLVLIADGFTEDVINNLILTKLQGLLTPVLIETPGFGEAKSENLRNIKVITGATIIDTEIIKVEDVTIDFLGSAKKLVSTKDKTSIISGRGDKTAIKLRAQQLQDKLETASKYDMDAINKHIAILQGGMALIKIGANTENEQKAIKAKVEDSVNATKLAFKDGIVKGGGKTYTDIKTSSAILNKALKAPFNQLVENGAEYLDEKVTDPAGVLIAALETGGSIACGLLEIGGIITTKREEKKEGNDY